MRQQNENELIRGIQELPLLASYDIVGFNSF
jgi:hypothetical protein